MGATAGRRAVGEQPRERDATNLECGFASQQFDQSDDLAAGGDHRGVIEKPR
jgi:hypothetical protein